MASVEQIIDTLIQNVKTEKGVVNIKSRFGKEYERPDSIRIKGKKKQITPDLVIESGNRTHMYIVELEASFDVEKWRLLSLYTSKLHGDLYILAPRDYEAFFSRKLEAFNITPQVEAIVAESGVQTGMVNVYVQGATSGIMILFF